MNTRSLAVSLSLAAVLLTFSCSSPTTPTADFNLPVTAGDTTSAPTSAPDAPTTLPSDSRGRPLTVWFVGDPGTCDGHGPYLTAAMIPRGEAILGLGDFAHPRGREKDFACFDASWGAHRPQIFAATGNHDTETDRGRAYCARFPEYCANGGFYSFDRENWHFVGLNSTHMSGQQVSWLKEDLRRNKLLCTVAFFHHPLYSSGTGRTGEVQVFWRELYEVGADLILNGHDHFYDRFAKQDPSGRKDSKGIRQITNGAGGVLLRTDAGRHANSEILVAAWGVGKLLLEDGRYSWQFIRADGGPGDAGSDTCNPKKAS